MPGQAELSPLDVCQDVRGDGDVDVLKLGRQLEDNLVEDGLWGLTEQKMQLSSVGVRVS